MTERFHSWRAAIRIARRDAWRNKGRSLLVLLMIALPVAGVSAMDVTARSTELSKEQQLDRELGAADARYLDAHYGGVPIEQAPDGVNYSLDEKYEGDPRLDEAEDHPQDVVGNLPPGAEYLVDNEGYAMVRTEHGLLDARVRELDAGSPIAEGITTPLRGRYPREHGEIAVSGQFLESSGLRIGSTTTVRGLDTAFTITGTFELPDELDAEMVLARPGDLLAPLKRADADNGFGYTTSYLVSAPDEVSWDMVRQANAKGLVVKSRAVVLDPPPQELVPGGFSRSSGENEETIIIAATVVSLAVLEICLLAGPAFAVGARRSRRQLGLIGANGGDRRHIRAVVLSGGLVLGVAAGVLGLALGLGLTVALRGFIEGYVGQRFGGIEINPLDLLGIALVALVTGLLAAVAPAFVASRQSVLEALTGRRGVRRSSRVLPVVGLVAVGLGAAIAVVGAATTNNTLAVGAGSAVAELGIVALTPALVGLFGRLGRWLPLSPRLALRDAVRNRGRTAPAVAAVLAAVAGTVAVLTYQASSEQGDRDSYQASLPDRRVSVVVDAPEVGQIGRVRTAVETSLPVASRADVRRITAGKDCSAWNLTDGCGVVETVVPQENECPLWTDDGPDRLSDEQRRKAVAGWRCAQGYHGSHGSALASVEQPVVGGADLLKALGVRDGKALEAIGRGEAVVFSRPHVRDGELLLKKVTSYDEEAEEQKGELIPFRAYLAKGHAYGVGAVIPPEAVEAAHLKTVPLGSVFTTEHTATGTERQKLNSAIANLDVEAQPYIERGFQPGSSAILLALTIFAGLVTIGAAAIATGLARADAEADLNTLAAVGAPPRVRRTLSGFQCGVIAAMGVVLGTTAGVLPAIGLRESEKRQALAEAARVREAGWSVPDPVHVPLVVPWGTLLELLVLVPLGAALLAALFTRSRSALSRRAAQ